MNNSTEIDLTPFMENTVVKRYEIDAELSGLHGEHNSRTQTIHQITYDETKELSDKEKQTTEKRIAKTTKPEIVHTFPIDKNGNYLAPIGGKYGYMMGALRAAILDLYKDKMQNKNWEGYGIGTFIEHGILVQPNWVALGKELEHPLDKPKVHMVKFSGQRESMNRVYYDVIKPTKIHLVIEITNTKIPENIFYSLLAHTQRLGWGPKGRGQFRITKVLKIKG